MILSSISLIGFHDLAFPGWEACLAYLRAFDQDTQPGKHDITGSDCFAMVQHYSTRPASEIRFEAHRCHIDVQFVVRGSECLRTRSKEGAEEVVPYDAEKDGAHYEDGEEFTEHPLHPGDLVVLFPGELHKPGCLLDSRSESVLKVVVKIPMPGSSGEAGSAEFTKPDASQKYWGIFH